MQFSRYLTYKKSGLSFRVWPWLLKVVLVAASFYYILSKIIEEQVVFREVIHLFSSSVFAFIITAVFILMSFNWLLESYKWQLIASKYQKLSIEQALKAILTGISLDAILPFGVGAVGSKVLSLNGGERNKLLGPIIISQGIQSFWTVAFGLFGLYQLALMTNLVEVYGGFYSFLLIGALIILTVVAIYKFWPNAVLYIVGSVKDFTLKIWIKIVAISALRYIVFFIQLFILSRFLAPEIPATVLVGCITWMFFAKTIIPKPGHLGALGIRGASVVFFLNLAGYSYSEVVLATLILWFINLAIPSLIGLFFVKDLNFKTNN